MSQMIYQIDAFTDRPFSGNPAGVCLLSAPGQAAWMQNVAREMNLSETAFLVRQADGFDLRWFTPAAEVRLCGHATLASAHCLWQTSVLAPTEQARFHTLSGLLTAMRRSDWIEMDFPARPPQPVEPPAGLAEALGVDFSYVGRDVDDYLVEVESEAVVRALKPDITALGKLPVRGTIVTARASDTHYDFVSRFFAPAVGVAEDPVTGSAHCCLTPYWADKLGKTEMTAYQASARGGTVKVRMAGNRVLLSGQAVTVIKCELIG
ncbi:MAG TPA: PhzF family phenazine biosynthesis protein [Anaerolineales bacterium]|nr:PhzF family phenazine biosynthesis protein [Anaerolineales bacterium]